MDFKTLRVRRELSIRQAANKLSVGYQSICRYENQGRVPKNEILAKMLKVYKCTEQELGEAVINNIRRRNNEESIIGDN